MVQQRTNKWQTKFSDVIWTVIDVKGTMVSVENEDGL
jgi:hypothetical protein